MTDKLSLLSRKNLKDYDERIKEKLAAIGQAVEHSGEVTWDSNQIEIAAWLEKEGRKDRIGEYMFDYITAVHNHLSTKFAKDEVARGALQAAWTTGVLRFVLNVATKSSKYASTAVDNGDLVVTIFKLANVSNCADDLMSNLADPATGLSLLSAVNLKSYEEKMHAVQAEIQAAVQLPSDVTVEYDKQAWAAWMEKESRKDRIGEYLFDYTSAVKSHLVSKFSKDEVARGALQAVWTTGILRFPLETPKKGESKYASTAVDNGDLVVTIYKLANVSNCADDLPNKLTDPATGLSLLCAQNLKSYEEKQEQVLGEIRDAVQLSADVTVEYDKQAWAAWMEKESRKDRIGEYLFDYTSAVKSHLVSKFAKSEIARGALQAVWTTGILRFPLETPKKGESKYASTAVDNGDLVVTIYKLANVSSCADDLPTKLTDPATNLPLIAALDWATYGERREKALQDIQSVVGLSSEVKFEVDLVAFEAQLVAIKRVNRPGEYAVDILNGLLNNLTKACKEEISKEAIAEAWTTSVIRLAVDPKCKSYHACDFVDGDLVISYKADTLVSNLSDVGNDIEKKL